ncbi:MAG TPA: hypothetical protein VK550_14785 [Polyangiaceae bacterium]|nr:hypothetical protein [Polyangiaceae bacterium]
MTVDAGPRAATFDTWDYAVTVAPGARELSVEARFPAGSGAELGLEDEAFSFVRDLCLVTGPRCEPPAVQGTSWYVPTCQLDGCKLRYRFALAEAAVSLRDPDLADAHEGVIVAPPSSWLVRPLLEQPGKRFRLQVSTAAGVAFATGVPLSPNEPGWFSAPTDDLPFTPYAAFGNVELWRTRAGTSALEIGFGPGEFAVGQRRVAAWIDDAARIVMAYYGRFPVPRALLLVLPTEGRGLGYGKALGSGGASMLVPLGRATGEAELNDDWVLVHEMLHLGFPSLPRQHIWLAEGIATYVEPIARARAGNMSPEAVWRGLLRGAPHGLPGARDEGLDNTHTWGRTYWGGALFCLLADLEIRERTQNRRSLDDALRAVLEKGGNITARWDIARVLEIGDAATGLTVLRDLYQSMALRRQDVDLPRLWQRLGIKPSGKTVVFEDAAPLAQVRRAITERPPDAPRTGAVGSTKEPIPPWTR